MDTLYPILPLTESVEISMQSIDCVLPQSLSDYRARLRSVAFVSTMPPTLCGLATFTSDLVRAVEANEPEVECRPIRLVRNETVAGGCALPMLHEDAGAYRRAGRALRDDVLCIQHEYGIFGGPDGEMLLDLLDGASGVPVVTTLHTVLEHPSANQRRVMDALLARSKRVAVMTRRSAAILESVHSTRPGQVQVIPHGIPDGPIPDRQASRRALGLRDQPMLLTFGLLSPGKGIEHGIRALPDLVRRWPDLVYLVMGATHPNLARREGERYRNELVSLASSLGVARNVRFVDRFVELPELTAALAAADVYLTPYLNEAQSVSGTLAYSYGLGTPVVSTPYHHATELLAEGRGRLVPFADPKAIADAVGGLLSDGDARAWMRRQAQREGADMLWSNVGRRYLKLFREAAGCA